MQIADEFKDATIDEIKAMLAGGTLTVYSVARPLSTNQPIDRSGVLAVFTFGPTAFGNASGELETPIFAEESVPAKSVGTPGFARACKADGTAVADFSAGPGNREIKFNEVSCSAGAPLRITAFKFMTGDWPERPDYFQTRPRPGYPMPSTP